LHLTKLNVQMQGKSVTAIDARDKRQSFPAKLDLEYKSSEKKSF